MHVPETSEILKGLGIPSLGASSYFSSEVGASDAYAFNGFDYSDINSQRVAVYPQWFFSARWGQPRQVNVLELRQFSRSPWVQMVMKAIKDQIKNLDWKLVNKDDMDDEEYKEQKEKVKLFLEHVNINKESWEDIVDYVLTDIMEIDGGVINKVFTAESYETKVTDVYDEWGAKLGSETRVLLKPLGKREMLYLQVVDSATFLKKTDVYKNNQGYFQYSFLNPQGTPRYFENDELAYMIKNKRSYDVYGFSPVQAVQQVVELLIQSTRWNKDFFKNNAIPDGIISLPGAEADSMKKFKNFWNTETKGKPHKIIFHNAEANFTSFMAAARDMEWLEGQKWYHWLVFGMFGISPVEAGFFQGVSQGNQEGQERITIKNGIKPYYKILERVLNRDLLPEILQTDVIPFKFEYAPKDHVEERIEHEQHMAELSQNVITINELRRMKGLKKVEWGDKPMSMYFMDESGGDGFGNDKQEEENDDATLNTDNASTPVSNNPKKGYIKFTKAFEGFMNGRTATTVDTE